MQDKRKSGTRRDETKTTDVKRTQESQRQRPKQQNTRKRKGKKGERGPSVRLSCQNDDTLLLLSFFLLSASRVCARCCSLHRSCCCCCRCCLSFQRSYLTKFPLSSSLSQKRSPPTIPQEKDKANKPPNQKKVNSAFDWDDGASVIHSKVTEAKRRGEEEEEERKKTQSQSTSLSFQQTLTVRISSPTQHRRKRAVREKKPITRGKTNIKTPLYEPMLIGCVVIVDEENITK